MAQDEERRQKAA